MIIPESIHLKSYTVLCQTEYYTEVCFEVLKETYENFLTNFGLRRMKCLILKTKKDFYWYRNPNVPRTYVWFFDGSLLSL